MLLLNGYTPVLRYKDKTFIAPNLYNSTDILYIYSKASSYSKQCCSIAAHTVTSTAATDTPTRSPPARGRSARHELFTIRAKTLVV